MNRIKEAAPEMNITEITDRPLSDVIAGFWRCENCGVVDANATRQQPGHKCNPCGHRSKQPSAPYFERNARSLIDLMQEMYHSGPASGLNFAQTESEGQNGHKLVLVILFCTLTEVLFQKFLQECMSRAGLADNIQHRLLRDNLYMQQRIKRLFPTLTGLGWLQAVKQLGNRNKQNYEKTARFYEEASEARNEFLHRGGDWVIPKEMPEQCVRQLRPLLLLFVDLHNEYATGKSRAGAGATV
jgi:hypothetical protein